MHKLFCFAIYTHARTHARTHADTHARTHVQLHNDFSTIQRGLAYQHLAALLLDAASIRSTQASFHECARSISKTSCIRTNRNPPARPEYIQTRLKALSRGMKTDETPITEAWRKKLGQQLYHVIGVSLLSQSAPGKRNQEKTHKPLRPLEFLKKWKPCLIIIYKNKQTFHMFSLRDLRFVLCSRDLDVLRTQRIIAFF